ncbi:MAG: sulfite exporter TauE/SafE family protein, partial [Myxococcota bacterium]
MEADALAWIGAAVFGTAALSGVLGMAGGVALLAVLLLYLPPLAAIPLHGVIQLVSNGSRTVVQRRHARFDWLLWYALPLIPAGLIGLSVAKALPEAALEVGIGAVVLAATWLPKRGGEARAPRPRLRLFSLGIGAGFLSMVIGAVGVLVDPFFLGLGLKRQSLIGTKAACQTLGHMTKVGIFGAAGFAFAPHLPLLAVGSVCAVAGTWAGSRLLDRMSEEAFLWLYRTVLTL